MAEITRYHVDREDEGELYAHDTGAVVLYEDHAAVVATLRAVQEDVWREFVQLRRFVGLVMHESRDGDDMDGGTVQSIAEQCGILNPVQVTKSCAGEDGYCACEEYGFPTTCYQFTRLGRACQNAALVGPDATIEALVRALALEVGGAG